MVPNQEMAIDLYRHRHFKLLLLTSILAVLLFYIGTTLNNLVLQEPDPPTRKFDPSLLVPEPPVPGMGFIAQKPDKGYKDFPLGIATRGHPFLRQRTYPTEPRPDSCDHCFPYIYRNVLEPTPCEDISTLQLLIVVTTVPKEMDLRRAIRQTWGRTTNNSRAVFLMGVGYSSEEQEVIFNESELYGDVLQENYIDSYYNLSLKVLSGYHWWKKKCPTLFVLRTATDCFNNIPGMLKLLHSRSYWPPRLIGGYPPTQVVTIRDMTNKWYQSPMENPYPTLGAFPQGTSVLTPANTVNLILENSPNVPYFHLEDAYWGMVVNYGLRKISGNMSAVPLTNVQLKNKYSYLFLTGNAINVAYQKKIRNGRVKCVISPTWLNTHFVKGPFEMQWIAKHCKS